MTRAQPWQLMPELTTEEYEVLKADIAEHGVRVPVVIDADSGAVIDGHHRERAWRELRDEGVKVPEYLRDVRRFASDEERVGFVLAANLFRRHLTRAQRKEIVARLREQGWSLRRIGEAVGVDDKTVRNDLQGADISAPSRIEGSDQKSYPPRRPRPSPSIVVSSPRDQHRAEAALQVLGDRAPAKLISLPSAEDKVRSVRLEERRAREVPAKITSESYELRLGDLREVWRDLPDHSVDAVVTDPPYNNEGVELYEDLARLVARVLKPGRLAAVYCGHVHLDEEMELLAKGGLSYVWHGVNVLPGQHTKIHRRKMNGRHRSVLLFSAGAFVARKWIHDAYWAEGRGGPETRPDHPWQQSIGTMRHWVHATSEPGEVVLDPFLGSGTCGLAALSEGRRFLGGDLDPACVETARERIEALACEREDLER